MEIIYNITANIHPDKAEEWLKWMREKHMDEVIGTGCFTHYSLSKMITRQPDEDWVTFVVQYYAPNIEDYHRYEELFAEKIRQEGLHKFGNNVLIFRSLMERL